MLFFLAQQVAPVLPVPMDPYVFAGALVVVLSSIGGTVVLIINALSASSDRREAAKERLAALTVAKAIEAATKEANGKADTLIKSTAQIHELTNSTNSNLQKALELKTLELQNTEKLVASLKEAAAALAMNQEIRDVRAAHMPASPALQRGTLTRSTDIAPPGPAAVVDVHVVNKADAPVPTTDTPSNPPPVDK